MLFSLHTKRKKEADNDMNKFAMGVLMGSAVAFAGIGYLMQDKKTYHKMVRKGKKLAARAEEVIDDIID